MSIKTMEWLGAMIGLLGSVLLALHVSQSGYGFALFLISNAFWLAYGMKTRAWGMVTMQTGYALCNLLGIARWLG